MKGLSKLVVLLSVLGLILGGVTPVLAGSNSDSSLPTVVNDYPVPKEIGGLPVIFVHAYGNTAGLQASEDVRATFAHDSTDPYTGYKAWGNNLLEKFAPLVPDSVDGYAIPKEIDGYPVVFVGTSDKIPWLQPGQVEIILLGNSRMEESMLNTSLNNSLIEFLNTHPRQWSVDITGGPNFSIDEFLSNLEVCIENYTGPVYSGGPGPSGPASPSAP